MMAAALPFLALGLLASSALFSAQASAPASRGQMCQQVVHHLSPVLNQLLSYLPVASGQEEQWNEWNFIATASDIHCRNPHTKRRLLQGARRIYREHSGALGLIMPAPAASSMPELTEEFHQGWRMACRVLGCSKQMPILVRYVTPGSQESLHRAIADLTLNRRVMALIGGWDANAARFLNEAARGLKTPAFLIRPFSLGQASAFTFHLFPHERLLANRLLTIWRQRGVRRLAVMQPAGHSADLLHAVRTSAQSYGVNHVQFFPYDSSRYASMESAAQRLLDLHPQSARSAEWQERLEQQKQAADLKGEPFDESSIFLSPRLDFDMVLIPDNAKVLRHFLKIFQYLRYSTPLPLAGTPLWRSEEVVKPWDRMMEGAFFVDFIGPYHQLPSFLQQGLQPTEAGVSSGALSHRGVFIDPLKMAPMDLRLIGYRTMSVALQMRYFDVKRKAVIASKLQQMYYRDDFFQNPQVFSEGYTNWPTFVFSLSAGRVHFLTATGSTSKLLAR